MKNYYEVLGVEKTASLEEVKEAFKQAAKKCHPDLHPEDESAQVRFQELNEAYETLKDEDSRAYYDHTGRKKGSAEDQEHQKLETTAANYFWNAVLQIDKFSMVDIIEECRKQIVQQQLDIEQTVEDHKKALSRMEKAANRLKRKSGDNKISIIILKKVEETKLAFENAKLERTFLTRLHTYMGEYEYVYDKALPTRNSWSTGGAISVEELNEIFGEGFIRKNQSRRG